jgi:hypothetical protein
MITIAPNPSRSIAPPNHTLDVSASIVPVVTAPGSTTTSTVRDANFINSTTATVRNDRQIEAVSTPPKPVAFSINSGAIDVNQNGYVTGSGNGSVDVRSGTITKRLSVNINTLGGQTISTFDGYVSGSLAGQLNQDFDLRLPSEVQVYSVKNNATSTYVRNANCWPGLDKTCWPVWNSSSANRFNGALISPRHICYAKHANVPNGAAIRFVTNDNEVVERTVGARIDIGTFDLRIAVLNADVPSSIGFAKVLPTDFLNRFTPADIPLLAGDQETKLVIREWTSYTETNSGQSKVNVHRASTKPNRSALSEAIVSGDSGSPVFVIIDNELVLLGCHFTAIGCPNIGMYATEVNAAMTTLGGGYQLTPIDLSAFTDWSL